MPRTTAPALVLRLPGLHTGIFDGIVLLLLPELGIRDVMRRRPNSIRPTPRSDL